MDGEIDFTMKQYQKEIRKEMKRKYPKGLPDSFCCSWQSAEDSDNYKVKEDAKNNEFDQVITALIATVIDSNEGNQDAFPYTFICSTCDKRHTAIAFKDNELEALAYFLDEKVNVFNEWLKTEKDKPRRKWMQEQLQVAKVLLSKINAQELQGEDA